MKGEILSLETTQKLANREKAIRYIKGQIKNMPNNGCRSRLEKVLKILGENL